MKSDQTNLIPVNPGVARAAIHATSLVENAKAVKDAGDFKYWDFRIGRNAEGKWLLGRTQHESQEEMLSALQDCLDETFGPEEYNALGKKKGILIT